MMYMDGDNNLSDFSWENIILAQKGLMNLDSAAKITVVALVDGNSGYSQKYPTDGKSYLLTLNGYTEAEVSSAENTIPLISSATVNHSKNVNWIYNATGTASQEVDMSAGNTLFYFLKWANTNYKAKKTIFIIQNHGGGPYNESFTSISARSLCWDDTTGTKRYISNKDISNAINWTFGKIDMLVKDVCEESAIELIYGLQGAVNYIVASPNITNACTFNYDKIIPFASRGASIPEIGKKFIDYNKASVENETLRKPETKINDPSCMEFSMTLIDCSKAETLNRIKIHTGELADAIISDKKSYKWYYSSPRIGKLVKNSTENFYGFSYETKYFYTQDLGVMSYMLAYKTEGASEAVKNAAKNLYTDFKDGGLIVYGWAGGKENSWYYSGDSSYGKTDGTAGDFLRTTLANGICPWGISITCDYKIITETSGTKYIYQIDDYSQWSEFGDSNRWAVLLKSRWHEIMK